MSDGNNVPDRAEEVQLIKRRHVRTRYNDHLALPNTFLCKELLHIWCHCRSWPLPISLTDKGVETVRYLRATYHLFH